MSQVAKLDEQKDRTTRAWRTAFFVLSFICLSVSVNNYQLRQTMKLWLPPDLSVGQVIQAGKVDEAYVYHFTYNIFNGLSRWKKDGEVEYKANIHIFSAYFSPNFRSQLEKDYAARVNEGRGRINELKGRTREVSLVSVVQPNSMVRKLSNSTYIVYLDVFDEERLAGQIVKSGAYRYAFNVEVDTSDVLDNETGLRIVGLANEPQPILN